METGKQRVRRVNLITRIKPYTKQALADLALAQGYKNPSRLLEHLIEQALMQGGSKQAAGSGASA